MKLKYVFSRLFDMDYRRMLKTVSTVSNKTKKNYFLVLVDMIYCGIRYQCGYIDYALFEMYNVKEVNRKTIVTRGMNNRFIDYFNDKKYFDLFRSKEKFNELFNDYLKRDWILLTDNNQEEFKKFIKNKDVIITKPLSGTCGKGIEKINTKDYDPNLLHKYLLDKNLLLVEEYIIQCDDLNKLYAGSINTVRLITVTKNGKQAIIAAYLRIGNNNNFVDNFNSGGMVAPIDVFTGIINYPALDKAGNLYNEHPITKTKIIGYQVPMFDEVIELGKKLADRFPSMGLIGWDISVSSIGPVVVEGNEFPGHDIYQLPPHRTGDIGMLPSFERAFNEIDVKIKDIR